MRWWRLLAVAGLLLAAGCGPEEAEPSSEASEEPPAEGPALPSDFTPPEAPRVSPLPSPTASLLHRLQGLAEAEALVKVTGGAAAAATIVGAEGRFEVDLRLRPHRSSTLFVTARDAAGNVSDATLLEVTHRADAPATEPGGPSSPVVEPLPGSTRRLAVTVVGSTGPWHEIEIEGGEVVGRGTADEAGSFRVGVALIPGTANELRVTAIDPAGRRSEPTSAPVSQDPSGARTRYPIILHHGYMGFRELLGIEYFWHVPAHLEEHGFDVRVTTVPPVDTVHERSLELRDSIREITSGKVNLIGHSMGGLDIRYVVGALGMARQAASITTIATPHHGSTVADLALGLTASGPLRGLALDFLLRRMGLTLAGARDLTVQRTRDWFNENIKDAPGVPYYSWSFVSDPFGLETGHKLDPLLLLPHGILNDHEGPNDGIVSVDSARWGESLGVLAADHLGEVGHLLGLTDSFDHLAFFLGEAERLERDGL